MAVAGRGQPGEGEGVPLLPGTLVTSTAGRDRGRPFVVVKILDTRFVQVADGELRRSQRPKKKNIRHLQPKGVCDERLAQRVASGRLPSDQEVREALGRLLGPDPWEHGSGADGVERA